MKYFISTLVPLALLFAAGCSTDSGGGSDGDGGGGGADFNASYYYTKQDTNTLLANTFDTSSAEFGWEGHAITGLGWANHEATGWTIPAGAETGAFELFASNTGGSDCFLYIVVHSSAADEEAHKTFNVYVPAGGEISALSFPHVGSGSYAAGTKVHAFYWDTSGGTRTGMLSSWPAGLTVKVRLLGWFINPQS